MKTNYSAERNTEMLISLMKKHNIRRVIASPGTTNMTFVASIQQDPFFKVYSSVDERSAAYIACGMAAESGEPVALSCTGATASRNYFPGLTEAFYRKLPVLAITSTQSVGRIGQNIPQVIDRSSQPSDTVKLSVQIPAIHDEDTRIGNNILINKALLELRRAGCGPVHINITTQYNTDYSVKRLPDERAVTRFTANEKLPKIEESKIGIFVGAHKKWDKELQDSVDTFCEKYNAVVLCDQTSNYKGKYSVLSNLITAQSVDYSELINIPILIHIGDVSGAHMDINAKEVWRVNPDGELRDTFGTLKYIFEMEEIDFFNHFNELKESDSGVSFYKKWKNEYKILLNKIPDLPFSNIWVAKNTASKLPNNSVLHLGILNTLRSWSFFEIPNTVSCYSNTGGFGIDGNVSSLLGASLVNKNKLYYGIVGDLAFFYDLNVNGNHYLGNNMRIMLINNGRGTEFRNYSHLAARFGDNADKYIAAAGHFGNKSRNLVKDFATDIGYEYISANNKEEYLNNVDKFIDPEVKNKPILFEVFTDSKDESNALKLMDSLEVSKKAELKNFVKQTLGDNNFHKLKEFLKK